MRRKGMGAGRGMGYKNLIPKDKVVHTMSGKGMKQPQRICLPVKEYIKGGMSGNRPDCDFDPKQLAMGIKVEMEHTTNPLVAKEIAKDHLAEFPDYYTGLAKLEDELKKEQKSKKALTPRQESNRNYEKYIIDSIDANDYGLEKLPETPKEKLQFLKDTFRAEYGHNIQRMGEQNAFAEWLSGLPSSFNIEFSNYEILKLAKKMGSLPENATEKQEDRVLENYWNFMANKTFQAFKKYGVK